MTTHAIHKQVCVHLFLTDGPLASRVGGSCDVATLGLVAQASGGATHFFPAAVAASGLLTSAAASAIKGTLGNVLRAVAANETVLKVHSLDLQAPVALVSWP